MKFPPIERKPDSSLSRMTPRQRQSTVKLIINICSNYDKGNCVLFDDVCGKRQAFFQ
ncbi:MAG: cysteine-rich VLP domain-containing protein [Oscillospiraceae bacterium]|nr:cysteine-rich VLP domain-containing protein [Oscillospiraceae bacterium]